MYHKTVNKNIALVSIVSGIALVGLLSLVYVTTNSNSSDTIYPEVKTLKANDHVTWSTAKKHILTEYSDLQCPACRNFHTLVKSQLETSDTIKKNITFVYRHFPLDIHAHSREAAYAAEAASKQGKFFEMADLMFETQDKWESSSDVNAFFIQLAQQLTLNIDQFKKDLSSPEVKKRVEEDYGAGLRMGVNATPTVYFDGKKINLNSFAQFKRLLEGAK